MRQTNRPQQPAQRSVGAIRLPAISAGRVTRRRGFGGGPFGGHVEPRITKKGLLDVVSGIRFGEIIISGYER